MKELLAEIECAEVLGPLDINDAWKNFSEQSYVHITEVCSLIY